MAIAPLSAVKGFGNDTYSTASMDTTGASLLVVTFADIYPQASPPVLSDTYGNTWIQIQRRSPGNDRGESIYYAWNPSVGSGHSVTLTGADQFGSAQFSAWTGVDTSADPLDQSNSNNTFSQSVQPGSVTPTSDGQLVVVGVQFDVQPSLPSINGGFSSMDGNLGAGGNYLGSAYAYLVQTTAAAANPTMTVTNFASLFAVIATFREGSGASPVEAEGAIGVVEVVGVGGAIADAPIQAVGAIGIINVVGVGGEIDGAPAPPGVWEQVAPFAPDPDDPIPGGNYGYQSIALAPDGTVFVTADYEGLWRSTDNGENWTHWSTDGDLEAGPNWTLQIDPTDPTIMWCTAQNTGGPLKSTDSGQTWTIKPGGSPVVNNDVYCIALDPTDGDHVLVTWHTNWSGQASSGVSESFDGGDTWTHHNAPTDDWGTGHAVFFLSSSTTWFVGTQDDGFWRTTNSGTNWTKVGGNDIDMTHGATDCLTRVGSTYYLATTYLGFTGRVYESTDDCQTWTDISTGLPGLFMSTVATDGTNLYTTGSFPSNPEYTGADGPWYERPISGGSWAAMTGSPDVVFNGLSNGPRQSANNDDYVYTVNYTAGVWRLQIEATAVEADGATGQIVVVGVGGEIELGAIDADGATGQIVVTGIGGVIQGVAVGAEGAVGVVVVSGVAGEVELGAVDAEGAVAEVVVVGVAGEIALGTMDAVGAVGVVQVSGVGGEILAAVVAQGAIGEVRVVGIGGVIEGTFVEAQGAIGEVRVVGVAGEVAPAVLEAQGAIGEVRVSGIGGEAVLAAVVALGAIGVVRVRGVGGRVVAGSFGPQVTGPFTTRATIGNDDPRKTRMVLR